MTRRNLISDRLPTPAGPYSHVAVRGDTVYTAGFGPQDPVTGMVPTGIEAQTVQVLRNVEVALETVGATLADIVKVTAHLQRLKEDYAGFNRAYQGQMPEPFPVRTAVGSDLPDILVEIDVIAMGGA